MRKRLLACLLSLILCLTALVGCAQKEPAVAFVKVMSWNILNPSWGGLPVDLRREEFFETLSAAAPDIAGIQEASSKWHEVFADLPAPYRLLNDTTDSGKPAMTMFLYNPERLEVIEHGIEELMSDSDIRIVSWAVMKDLESGVSFLITNTHPDSRETECLLHTETFLRIAGELYADKQFPLLCVGDFNAIESSAAYALTVGDGFTDCKYAESVDLINDIDSYLLGDFGGVITRGEGSRDHIFFKGAVEPTRFETLCGDTVQAVSDHLPVTATVGISNP